MEKEYKKILNIVMLIKYLNLKVNIQKEKDGMEFGGNGVKNMEVYILNI